jgi:hypothetical protein
MIMPNNTTHFSLEKVKELRAYFEQSRKSAKGKPEYGDLETTVKLTEQLIALMEQPQKPVAANVAVPQH